MTDPALPSPAVQRLRAASVALVGALVLLGVAWETVLAPTGRGTLAVKVLPLVVALPGLLRHRLYTYRWLSLAVWLYAAEGAVRAGSERGLSQSLAVAEVVLVVALFAVLGVYIRSRLRAGREVAA